MSRRPVTSALTWLELSCSPVGAENSSAVQARPNESWRWAPRCSGARRVQRKRRAALIAWSGGLAVLVDEAVAGGVPFDRSAWVDLESPWV